MTGRCLEHYSFVRNERDGGWNILTLQAFYRDERHLKSEDRKKSEIEIRNFNRQIIWRIPETDVWRPYERTSSRAATVPASDLGHRPSTSGFIVDGLQMPKKLKRY
jgi:hypothetical protein